jgi:hypothetical protein
LSTKQELGIVHYIKVQAAAARPASPKEILKLANEMYLSTLPETIQATPSGIDLLGMPWCRKFYGRYPSIKTTYTRGRDRACIDGVHPDKVQPFYNVLEHLYRQHRYLPCDIFDMDKTGYAMGDIERRRCLTYVGAEDARSTRGKGLQITQPRGK